MKIEKFKKLIDNLRQQSDKCTALYALGVDVIDLNNELYRANDILLSELYTDEQFQWLEWWLYEKNFGRKEDLKATDKDGKEICRTVEELYEIIYESK